MKLPDIYIHMIITLVILAAIGIGQVGIQKSLPQLAIAVVVTSILDFIIKYYKQKKAVFPKSAIITGLFIGSLLNPGAHIYIIIIASIIAILSKHIIKIDKKQIFNPAAFGLVVSYFLFKSGASWWSASSVLSNFSFGIPLEIIILGILICYRIKRLKTVFVFLLFYNVIFFLTGMQLVLKNPIALLNPLVLFFAFLMLIEHRSSPLTVKSGAVYGIIVAVMAFVLLYYVPGMFLLLALLVGNAFNFVNNKFKLII